MQDSSGGRGGTRSGAGRRSRYGTPMPRSAFTARPDQIVFYLLLSGNEKTVSAGVQRAVAQLVKADQKAAKVYEQALWMTNQAKAELEADAAPGTEVNQDMIMRYILDHHERIAAMWEDQDSG